MPKWDKFKDDLQCFSREERAEIISILGEAEHDPVLAAFLARLAAARRRTYQKMAADTSRTLVGARVPREFHARCQAEAEKRGISLYRFVVEALEQMCDNGGGSNP